jgi:hypothetical protein
MNNVTIKNKLLLFFILGVIIIPFIIIMLLTNNNITIFLISITPIWFIYFFGNFILYLNNADISINESNNVIIIKTIYNEKKFPLDELKIKNHVNPRRLAFIFYTNSEKIILNYTQQNYNIILQILMKINYPYIKQFIEDVDGRASIYDLK